MSSSNSSTELTILSVEPQDSYVQDHLFVHHAASHVYVEKKGGGLSFPVSFNLVKVQDMYIYKSFWVYFHMSSDTGPNMFFFFWYWDFLYSGCFVLFFSSSKQLCGGVQWAF